MADTLTPREAEVLALHDQGMRNVDIAERLEKAPGTISNALVSALKKSNRESEVGGNGPSTGGSVGGLSDPEEKFKRDYQSIVTTEMQIAEQVESFPADFETWLSENDEELRKQFDARRASLMQQATQAQESRTRWQAMAEKLGVTLDPVETETPSEPSA